MIDKKNAISPLNTSKGNVSEFKSSLDLVATESGTRQIVALDEDLKIVRHIRE